jgi:phage shock protein C
MTQARLMRSETDKIIAGVGGGLAAYLGINSTLVRLAFLLLVPASGIGLLLYLFLMITMPSASNVDKRPGEVMQENLHHIGENIAGGAARIRQHPQSQALAALALILLGGYLLLNNLGWFAWLDGLLLPLVLIGLGAYLILRRRA